MLWGAQDWKEQDNLVKNINDVAGCTIFACDKYSARKNYLKIVSYLFTNRNNDIKSVKGEYVNMFRFLSKLKSIIIQFHWNKKFRQPYLKQKQNLPLDYTRPFTSSCKRLVMNLPLPHYYNYPSPHLIL